MKRFLRSPRRVITLVVIGFVSFCATFLIAQPAQATHNCFTQTWKLVLWEFSWQHCPVHAPPVDDGPIFEPLPDPVPIIIEVPKRIVNCCP